MPSAWTKIATTWLSAADLPPDALRLSLLLGSDAKADGLSRASRGWLCDQLGWSVGRYKAARRHAERLGLVRTHVRSLHPSDTRTNLFRPALTSPAGGRWVRVPTELIIHPSISSRALVLWCLLADHTTRRGRATDLSQPQLGDLLGVCPDTVRRLTRQLEAAGWCDTDRRPLRRGRRRRGRCCNAYRAARPGQTDPNRPLPRSQGGPQIQPPPITRNINPPLSGGGVGGAGTPGRCRPTQTSRPPNRRDYRRPLTPWRDRRRLPRTSRRWTDIFYRQHRQKGAPMHPRIDQLAETAVTKIMGELVASGHPIAEPRHYRDRVKAEWLTANYTTARRYLDRYPGASDDILLEQLGGTPTATFRYAAPPRPLCGQCDQGWLTVENAVTRCACRLDGTEAPVVATRRPAWTPPDEDERSRVRDLLAGIKSQLGGS